MAYHLPALQPLWSFASTVTGRHACDHGVPTPSWFGHAVQEWALDGDGRPRMRWAVGRYTTPSS